MLASDPLKPIMMREAGIQDLERIMEMENTVFGSEAFSRRQYRHLLKSAACSILLYEAGTELAGMVAAGWRARTDYLWIYSIAVSPQMRGQGLGGLMLEECLKMSRELQRRWIILEVRVSNETAIRLYHRFGFEEVGFLADYYGDGHDGMRMALEVKPEARAHATGEQSNQTGAAGTST
jgi:[ribosomal protein S18]-alanine N-acetyltransferase